MREIKKGQQPTTPLKDVQGPELSPLDKKLATDPVAKAVYDALRFDGQYTSLEIGSDFRHALGNCVNAHLRALRELVKLGEPKAKAMTHIDLRWCGATTLKDLADCEHLFYLDTRASNIRTLRTLGPAASARIRHLSIDESCGNSDELKPFTAIEYLWICNGKMPSMEPLRGHQTLRELWVTLRYKSDGGHFHAIEGWDVLPTIPNMRRMIIDTCEGFTPEILGQMKALEDLAWQHQTVDVGPFVQALLACEKLNHISLHDVHGLRDQSIQDAMQQYANQRPNVTIWLDGKKISAQTAEEALA